MSASAPMVAGKREGPSVLFPNPLVEFVLRLGDDRLVLGHRLSEWCGHGPILEEDIALANIALDLVGQASALLKLAGEIEGKGRDEDGLAYFREPIEYRNVQMVELPRGDFAFTIVRQFLFDAYSVLMLDALSRCGHPTLAALGAKSLKEDTYHLRHSSEWMLKLGDGTAESQARVQNALNELWRFSAELFESDAVNVAVAGEGIVVDMEGIRARWQTMVADVVKRATLTLPTGTQFASGGRRGRHTEYLGHLLAEMQSVARSHPGAKW